MYFDKSGNLQKTNVVIVCGPPASGKTTYVKQKMKTGDCVVDLDYIKSSISMRGKTETTDNLLVTALKIRDFLYSEIEADKIQAPTVWIIAGLPLEKDRVNMQARFNADIVCLDVPKETCLERAMLDNERKDKKRQIEVIDKYFVKRTWNY